MEQIVLAKFCDPHIGAPQLRLHDVRVEMAQASRELALRFRWIGLGEIEMQIRHGWLLYDVGAEVGHGIHQSGALSACVDLSSEIWARCAKPRPKEIFSPGVS